MGFIIYNPYKKSHLFKPILYYKVLNGSFCKRFLFKRFINDRFYIRASKFINQIKTRRNVDHRLRLFKIVEIETINRCNNKCSFCPVNKERDKRIFQRMSNKVYEKIINELSFINYSGTIFFHSNNEPLLDDELEDKIKYANQVCKNAFLSFYTNGTLLNLEIVFKFKSAGIDKITINNYNNELILNENIQKIVNKLKVTDPKLYPKIVIILRKSDEVLNNRGGLAPNKNKNLSNEYKLFRNSPCYLPFEEIIVRADGKVSLCSNDAYGKKTLGDITKGDLRTIWSGAKFNEVREKLSTFKRYELDLCKECDK